MRGMILFEHYVVSMFLVKREQEDNKVESLSADINYNLMCVTINVTIIACCTQ